MTPASRCAATLTLLAGVAGCDSIGEGNTIETLTLTTVTADSLDQGEFTDIGGANERYHMYDCFCTNLAAVATFTDGTLSNFNSRVTFTSSNPAVLTVMDVDDVDTLCPEVQRGAGLLIPHGVGTATITASFAGISDTLVVDVADASAGTYTLEGAAPAPPGSFDVAVGSQLQLALTGTLDGRTRIMNGNVLTWAFDTADDAVATINSGAVVTGFAPTGAAPKVARASFGVCNDLSPTAAINVGDVLGPLVLEREAPDFATDGLLAVDTDEQFTITAPLDFNNDGNADGSQLVSSAIELSFTDTCTLRSYDAGVPVTSCLETPGSLCTDTTPTCTETTATTCESTMVSCRVGSAPIIKSGLVAFPNRVVARLDTGSPTNFNASFPHIPGTPTDLTTAIDAVATTLTVTALTGYPSTTPWYAVIDAAGTREDVRVTAVTGTTLTVVRGLGGTTAAPHAIGATFEERSYTSDLNAPLVIRAKEGELTEVAVDAPGTLVSLGTLQLAARGTFVDQASASRQQRVTRLVAPVSTAPTVVWSSSDNAIATVGANTGLVTSRDRCGGRVNVRARASTSTDATTAAPHDPDTTADDDACENTDALCDQVELCVATPSPLPLGLTCDTVTTCP